MTPSNSRIRVMTCTTLQRDPRGMGLIGVDGVELMRREGVERGVMIGRDHEETGAEIQVL